MAIEYFLYTDLSRETLHRYVSQAAERVGDLWVYSGVQDDLGLFHEEIMQEYGISSGFQSRLYSRHDKFQSIAAGQRLFELYDTLPGRKLLLNGDVMIRFDQG